MGKVKDEAPAKANKPAAKGPKKQGWFAPFVANLVRGDTYKPAQGFYARVWTAGGLGVLVAAGLYRLYVTQLQDQYAPAIRIGIPAVLGAALAWIIYRVVQYPPFADFLIATEAEMNKVSWTSRDDLKRATAVVLFTVIFLALFLFGVDWVWSSLLQAIGILKFNSGDFGSQAG